MQAKRKSDDTDRGVVSINRRGAEHQRSERRAVTE
jgi:hypothetical protein